MENTKRAKGAKEKRKDEEFIFKEEKIKSIQFTGMINRNDILKDIFELFEASYDLKFQVNDSGVLVVEK